MSGLQLSMLCVKLCYDYNENRLHDRNMLEEKHPVVFFLLQCAMCKSPNNLTYVLYKCDCT